MNYNPYSIAIKTIVTKQKLNPYNLIELLDKRINEKKQNLQNMNARPDK